MTRSTPSSCAWSTLLSSRSSFPDLRGRRLLHGRIASRRFSRTVTWRIKLATNLDLRILWCWSSWIVKWHSRPAAPSLQP